MEKGMACSVLGIVSLRIRWSCDRKSKMMVDYKIHLYVFPMQKHKGKQARPGRLYF